MQKNITVLKDEIDMSKIEVFLVHIYYTIGSLEVVAVKEEKDIKKLITAIRHKQRYVVLDSRIKTEYNCVDEIVTAQYEIKSFEIDEINIVAIEKKG